MPRANKVYTNFSAGELSPRLAGRTDIDKFFSGCHALENYIVLPGGGIESRPGTHFVNPVFDESKKTRLIPFVFSSIQAYQLEFGDTYVQIYSNNGRVESPPGFPVMLPTPYLEADLFDLKYAQNADTLYIFHQKYQTLKITRTSDTSWSSSPVQFWDGPYITPGNTDPLDTLQVSHSAVQSEKTVTNAVNNGGGLIRLTVAAHGYNNNDYVIVKNVGGVLNANGVWQVTVIDANTIDLQGSTFAAAYTSGGTAEKLALLAANFNAFTAQHVGASFRLFVSGSWGWVVVRKFIDATTVAAEVMTTIGGLTATATWLEGLWSDVQGWPAWGTFHEQRLVAGGSTQKPQTIAGSKSGDFENMDAGTSAATDAYTYTIGSNQVNNTLWGISTAKAMQIGTLSQEFIMSAASDAAITPTNVRILPHTPHGSNNLSPVRAYSYTLFMQRAGRKLRQLKYDIYSDAFIAEDLTLLSEHITEGGIVDMCFQQEPYSAVWMVRADGQLLSMTYNPLAQMYAWSRHTTPNGKFEAVSVIPSPDGGADQVWVIVQRTVNGVSHRFVEYFDPNLSVDSGLTYSGVPVNSVSNLTHLNGEVVAIVGDGAVYPSKTVAAGTVSLDGNPASEIQAGLQFTPLVTLNRPEVKGESGIQGIARHWADFQVLIHETLGLQAGQDQANFRNTSDPMGSEPAPFTGTKQFSVQGWDTDGKITLRQPLPLKSTILAAFGTLDIGDDD
jgi:hypothetical protein